MKTRAGVLVLMIAAAIPPVGLASEQTDRGKYLVEEVAKLPGLPYAARRGWPTRP
jgi:hypothetical protein